MLQIRSQSCVFDTAVVKESAIAVNLRIGPFLEYACPSLSVQTGPEVRAMGVLNAMNRPKDLGNSVLADPIADLLPGMIRSEALVVGWMPILGCNDQVEAALLFIRDSDYLIPARNCQGTARKKVILNVDQNESVHVSSLTMGASLWNALWMRAANAGHGDRHGFEFQFGLSPTSVFLISRLEDELRPEIVKSFLQPDRVYVWIHKSSDAGMQA